MQQNPQQEAFVQNHGRGCEADRILHGLLSDDLSEEEAEELRGSILTAQVSGRIRYDLLSHIADRNVDYEWAVADFIAACYQYPQVFKGTSGDDWKTWEELSNIMEKNIQSIFPEFCPEELLKILYCICRIEHEHYPENETIERLRVEYLKPRVVG